MNRPSFDVLREPWIPVVRPDGGSEEVGIIDALLRAHELAAVRHPSPTVEFGLYRLLVAFLLDAMGLCGSPPEVEDDLRDLMAAGRIDPAMLERYERQCGDVFDLFHPDRPFLQTATSRAPGKCIAVLFPQISSGTNVVLWQHGREQDSRATPAEAARHLVALSAFCTEGGRGRKGERGKSPSINGAPPLYVLVLGRTLHASLVLNTPLRDADQPDPGPAWRNPRKPGGGERTRAGVLEALTWRPRAVLLAPRPLAAR